MDSTIRWDTHAEPAKRSVGYCGCGSKAVYFRRYEGNYYCKNCLVHQVEKRFKRTMEENNLVSKGERIAVGLSGGKDSSVLLMLMHKYCPDIEIIAVTVNEGIAGYRDKSVIEAEKLCKSLGVEHRIFSFSDAFDIDIDQIKTDNYCTFCGVFRRQLLNKAATGIGADKLAIGHNMDDEVQSIMMNVVRGDFVGFQRLASRIEGFIPRIKPLRDIPEKEVKLYAILQAINFYDGECPHSFNNVRRDVQKIVNDLEEKYPGTKMQILSFYNKSKEIKSAGKKELTACKRCGSLCSHNLCKACELLAAARLISQQDVLQLQ